MQSVLTIRDGIGLRIFRSSLGASEARQARGSAEGRQSCDTATSADRAKHDDQSASGIAPVVCSQLHKPARWRHYLHQLPLGLAPSMPNYLRGLLSSILRKPRTFKATNGLAPACPYLSIDSTGGRPAAPRMLRHLRAHVEGFPPLLGGLFQQACMRPLDRARSTPKGS